MKDGDKKDPATAKKSLKRAGFAPVDPATDGHELGMQVGTKLDFKTPGDYFTGILMSKRQLDSKDNPWCYSFNNSEGDFWSYGNTVMDGRMRDVSEFSVLTIKFDTWVGEPNEKTSYKRMSVTVYSVDGRFDPMIHTVGQATLDDVIDYYERPAPLPQNFKAGEEPTQS